jgi:hypothetical protein
LTWLHGNDAIRRETPGRRVQWVAVKRFASASDAYDLAVASQFLADDRLDACQIHVRARRDPRDLGGNLGPMKELAHQTIGPRAGCSSLRSIVGFRFVDLHERTGVGLPSSSDSAPPLQP